MELYIIRHGQSANNALDSAAQVRRHYDPPLTALGQAQAEAAARYFADGRNRDPHVDAETGYSEADTASSFGITHLYCSAMTRAMQTARPIGEALGLKPEIWLDVHEYGGLYLEADGVYTGYPGRTRAEIEADFPGYIIPDAVTERGWWAAERGYEPFAAGVGRAAAVAWELLQRAKTMPDARIALVTHGTFIDSLLKGLFGQLPNPHFYYLHYNTGITRIDLLGPTASWPRDRMIVHYINRTNHLAAEQLS